MFARLILALLLAAFAVPASAAACHVTPPVAASHHAVPTGHRHQPVQQPDRAMPAHGCIGCIPPSDWAATRVPAPLGTGDAAPDATVRALASGDASPPTLPPPRRV